MFLFKMSAFKSKRRLKSRNIGFFLPSYENKAQLLSFEEDHDWMTPCDICSWPSWFLRGKEVRKGMKKERRGKDYVKRIKTKILYGKGGHEFSSEPG